MEYNEELNEEQLNPSADDEGAIFVERKRWVFLGLPFTFTKYIVKPDLLTLNEGFFKSTENDCYMYKIQDVRLTRTLGEKIFGLGTVECFSGDVTNPELILVHIKHAQEVKNYILKASEQARLKRRTMTTLDIGAVGESDFTD